MGGKCCTDRKEAARDAAKAKAAGKDPSGSKSIRPSVRASNAYDSKKRAISVGYHSNGGDAEKMDKACENNDLNAFVALLTSTQLVQSSEERMHPWAANPRTVGALAGAKLAMLSSVAGEAPAVKGEIREAGAIPPLVGFLRSREEDRVQTAVVALSFLTADCPANTEAAFDAGAMQLLMQHLDSPIAGMRAAAATTLRNICMEKEEYRRAFVSQGGLVGLVGQLGAPADPSLNHVDVQLEAILNLQDLIEDDDGGVVEEYALAVVRAGAEARLEQLMPVVDDDVRASAEELLASLASARAGGG